MLKVGLTGNVASGKSTVAAVWTDEGATVIDADVLARRAVDPGTRGLARVVELWGPEILAPDGTLDRAALREIVFRDPDARARLEAIVHPEVARLRDEAAARAAARGEAVVVADIPLLFEAGMEAEFDVVVLVHAPEEVRLERMVRDRGLDPDAARRIAATQIPSEQKLSRADIVIENTGTVEALRQRAREVWAELRARPGAVGGG